jgi:hypothetical protein
MLAAIPTTDPVLSTVDGKIIPGNRIHFVIPIQYKNLDPG